MAHVVSLNLPQLPPVLLLESSRSLPICFGLIQLASCRLWQSSFVLSSWAAFVSLSTNVTVLINWRAAGLAWNRWFGMVVQDFLSPCVLLQLLNCAVLCCISLSIADWVMYPFDVLYMRLSECLAVNIVSLWECLTVHHIVKFMRFVVYQFDLL